MRTIKSLDEDEGINCKTKAEHDRILQLLIDDGTIKWASGGHPSLSGTNYWNACKKEFIFQISKSKKLIYGNVENVIKDGYLRPDGIVDSTEIVETVKPLKDFNKRDRVFCRTREEFDYINEIVGVPNIKWRNNEICLYPLDKVWSNPDYNLGAYTTYYATDYMGQENKGEIMKQYLIRDVICELIESDSCSLWKSKGKFLLEKYPLTKGQDKIEIPEGFINEVIEKGTSSQKNLLIDKGIVLETPFDSTMLEVGEAMTITGELFTGLTIIRTYDRYVLAEDLEKIFTNCNFTGKKLPPHTLVSIVTK